MNVFHIIIYFEPSGPIRRRKNETYVFKEFSTIELGYIFYGRYHLYDKVIFIRIATLTPNYVLMY